MDLGSTCGFGSLNGAMRVDGRKGSCQFQDFVVSSHGHDQGTFRNGGNFEAHFPVFDFRGKAEPVKKSCEDDRSYVLEGNNGGEMEMKELHWQRVKWTDQMVKLLITAISYVGEDAVVDCGGSGSKVSHPMTKKGKWKAISKVMDERGFCVSPQQCEDKFNDLNKRYKKLNDILGRGTSCQVVENPALLELMDISDKAKECARKILGSKQLFFEEMCSYHNGNRLFIPHDASVQRSLQLALGSNDNMGLHEAKAHDYEGDEENSSSYSPNSNLDGTISLNRDLGSISMSAKRKMPGEHESMNSGYVLDIKRATKKSATSDHTRMTHAASDVVHGDWQGNHLFSCQDPRFEEQRLLIESEMLELEKQRLRWLKYNELEDREIEKMRLENEHLRLENERVAFQIKHRRTLSGVN